MIDNPFRSFLEKTTKPIICILKKTPLTPNQLTLLSLVGAIGSSWAIINNQYLLAICLWWLGRLFDGLDGLLARAKNQSTQFGSYLDITCDMLSYSLIILSFSYIYPNLIFHCLIILTLYILAITSALSLGQLVNESKKSKIDNRGLSLGAGLAEAGETGIFYTLVLLLPQFSLPLFNIWIIILIISFLSRTYIAYNVERSS